MQVVVEIAPVGLKGDGLRTPARDARWGRTWGEACWALDDSGAELTFSLLTSTELVVRALAMPRAQSSSKPELLGEARLLPAAGLSGTLALPLLLEGRVAGTVSVTVTLWLVDGAGGLSGPEQTVEPWEPCRSREEFAEEMEQFPTRTGSTAAPSAKVSRLLGEPESTASF